MPSLRHYWGKSGIFGVKLIKKTMNRDRFLLILKFLHFADNMGTFLPGDKLHKIKNFIDMFNEQCENLLEPGTELVIDETMVSFKGRLSFKQYIMGKRHKNGIKLFKLCTLDDYCLKIIVYSGKHNSPDSKRVIGHAHEIVLNLMDKYLYSQKILYNDNFYNTIPLAEDLLNKQTYVCGTLRKNLKGITR